MTIKEYLKQDRQWPRVMRIAHAQLKLRQAEGEDDKKFWTAILKANGAD